jgi:hypothetical protein
MKLEDITTKNFHYSEFFYSKTAKEKNINNTTSNKAILKNLVYTASQIQKIRELLKKPIIITSGYRCEYLNKLVGGSVNSYHLIGQAVDFVCPKFSNNPNDIIKAIKKSGFEVDQCIAEFTKNSQWVHISFLKKPRNSFLIYDRGTYRKLD